MIRKVNSPQHTAFMEIEFQKRIRKEKTNRKPNLLMSQKQVNELSNKLQKPSGTQASLIRIKALGKDL